MWEQMVRQQERERPSLETIFGRMSKTDKPIFYGGEEAKGLGEYYGSTDYRDLNVWNRWANDWEDMGKLEKIFSILNRGQFAAANVVASVIHGDGNVAAAAWRGLTAQERGDFVDLLDYYDIPWAPVLGTILNIGLDPTTYLGGPISLVKRGVKQVGKTKAVQQAISMVSDSNVFKMLDNMFNVHAGIPKVLGETKFMHLYRMTAEQSGLAEMIEKTFGEIPYETSQLVAKHILEGTVPENPKQLEAFTSAVTMLAEYTQKALDLNMITEEAAANLQYLPVIARDWIKEGYVRGQSVLGPSRFSAFAMPKTTRLTTEKLRSFADTFWELSRQDDPMQMILMAKHFVEDKSHPATEELLKIVKEQLGSKYGDNIGKVQKVFEKMAKGWEPVDDIKSMLVLYGTDLVRHNVVRDFKNYVLRSPDAAGWAQAYKAGDVLYDQATIWGEYEALAPVINRIREGLIGEDSYNGVPKQALNTVLGWFKEGSTVGLREKRMYTGPQRIFQDLFQVPEKVAEILKLTDDSVQLYTLDKGVADHLSKVHDLFLGGKAGNELLKMYDKALSGWKKWTTIMRPPFHLRNFIGNTARAYLADVSPFDMPGLIKKASLIQRGSEEVIEIGGISKTGAQWLYEASVRGVRGFGFTSELVDKKYADTYLEILRGTAETSMPKKILEWPEQFMRNLGLAIEDNSRIMVMIDKLGKNAKLGDLGLRLDDAAKHSWKYLFQYDQLTGFEKGVMKRIFPFYTWMRKNIPLQIESILDNPGRYAAATKVFNVFKYADTEAADDETFLPSYMRDYGYFKVPDKVADWFSSVTKADYKEGLYVNVDLPWKDLVSLTEPVKTMLNSLSPAALPLQLGLNSKAFPEPGTPIERFKGELRPAPWPMSWLPTGVWPLLGMQPIIDRDTGKSILGMPAKAVYAVETLFPILSELSRMSPQVAELEPEDAPWRRLRWITGVSFTPVSYKQQRLYYELAQKQKLADVGKLITQLGRGLTDKELERLLR